MTTQPPVVSGGFPLVGHLVEFQRDRAGLFRRGFEQHGDVFSIKLAGQNVAVVTGAEHNKKLFNATDKQLNMDRAYTSLKAAFGETLFIAGKDAYYNQRQVLQAVFKREKMAGYIDAMNLEVQRWLDGFGLQGRTNICADMVELTQYVAGHAMLGPDFRDELSPEFWDHYRALGQAIDPVIPPNLPLPKFIRRDRARASLQELVGAVIDRRRAALDDYDDLISHLLTFPQKDGEIMADEHIVNLLIGILFAGHETTAGQAAWLIILLLQHPEHLARVTEEVEEHIGDDLEIGPKTLRQLKFLYHAIDETTRMRPSADVLFRFVEEDIAFGEYTIPEGWGMLANAENSHNLASVYTNPDVFDPGRYERGEGKGAWHLMGFGGGMHKCTGMNFAKNEMAIIIARLIKQFDIELLSADPHVVTGMGANHPSDAFIRYTRKVAFR